LWTQNGGDNRGDVATIITAATMLGRLGREGIGPSGGLALYTGNTW
jgi:hypothetical protein